MPVNFCMPLHLAVSWAILFFGGYRFFGLGAGQSFPGDCRDHIQSLCRLLDHHVGQIYIAAHPH